MEHFLLYWVGYLLIFIGSVLSYFLGRYTPHNLPSFIIFCVFCFIGTIVLKNKKEEIRYEAKIMTFCTEVMQIEVDDTSKLEKCVKLTRDFGFDVITKNMINETK